MTHAEETDLGNESEGVLKEFQAFNFKRDADAPK